MASVREDCILRGIKLSEISTSDSSIGDVGTIRSKLQERRKQLNHQISIEKDISVGSKKLAKSSKSKVRDHAFLEHTYALSKIQLLQSELAKINSSLQAYQPESARDHQIPLIPIATKTTTKISFISSFSELSTKHYHTSPSLVQDAIYDFQELRFSVATPTKDESGIELLYEYLSQLVLVSKRFLHPQLPHNVVFTWHDAINGLPAMQKSTVYEKACVIFNIGCLHSQIAAKQDRSTHVGIDSAIYSLEKALGVFEYMKHNFSNSPTLDMSTEILCLISDLMRAQVVELQWEKDVLKGLDEVGDITKLIEYAQRTKSISECYKPVREVVDDSSMKDYIPPCWVALIKIKDAHYKSLAHYYGALIHERLSLQCVNGGEEKNALLDLKRASVATELHFLYTSETTNIDELFSANSKSHMGLVKSHLNCAQVLHEYSIRYKNLCRELEPITVLEKVLKSISARTIAKKEQIQDRESLPMIAPTIQPSMVDMKPVLPNFSSHKVKDLFRILGPITKFCGDSTWSPPRKLTVRKENGSFGFSIKGSKPVRISGVDEGTSAQREGLLLDDWILKANGKDVRFFLHDEFVSLVKDVDELKLEVTSPVAPDNPPNPTS